MNNKMKCFTSKNNYMVLILIWLCLYIIMCSQLYAETTVSSKQAFYNKIQKDRDLFGTFLRELESLKKQENLDGISDKKSEIFLVMETILKQKRQLFQAKVNELQLQYASVMHNGGDMNKLDSVHNEMISFESIIEKITARIKKYTLRRKRIFNEKIKRHTKVVSKAEIDAQKKEIVTLIIPLVAKRDNLLKGGANPSEIYDVKREIGLLTKDYIMLGKEIGLIEEESLNELGSFIDDIDGSFDEESERRKYDPDKYKYRLKERAIDRGVKYKRLNERSSSVRRIYEEEDKKKDQRLDAVRIEHDKAAKTILGK